nr:hypothetical protein [Streptomyces tsukubensis NRRL18488]
MQREVRRGGEQSHVLGERADRELGRGCDRLTEEEGALTSHEPAELAEFEDVQHLVTGQSEGIGLPQGVAQRQDGSGEAVVGNQLEGGGGGGVAQGPDGAQRLQDGPNAA